MKFRSLIIVLAMISFSAHAKEKGTTMKEKAVEVLKSKEGTQIIHKQFSSVCFNKTWAFIDKKDLSKDEIEDMIATSYASLWHWKQREDCKAQNLSIAYWQLGRVYCVAQKADIAKEIGEKCLKISQKGKLDPFYIGYAYEVLINASVLQKNKGEAKKYLKLANEQVKLIKNKENQIK